MARLRISFTKLRKSRKTRRVFLAVLLIMLIGGICVSVNSSQREGLIAGSSMAAYVATCIVLLMVFIWFAQDPIAIRVYGSKLGSAGLKNHNGQTPLLICKKTTDFGYELTFFSNGVPLQEWIDKTEAINLPLFEEVDS